MEELVEQLTKALMLHAVDLSAITNSQVMIVIETPTGDRFWSANGKLRNEFIQTGRLANREWGMKEVSADESDGSSALPETSAAAAPAAAAPPASRGSSSPAPSSAAAAVVPPASSAITMSFSQRSQFFQQQQQQLLNLPPPQQQQQQLQQKQPERGGREEADPHGAKRPKQEPPAASGVVPPSSTGPPFHGSGSVSSSLGPQFPLMSMSVAPSPMKPPPASGASSSHNVNGFSSPAVPPQHLPTSGPSMRPVMGGPFGNVPLHLQGHNNAASGFPPPNHFPQPPNAGGGPVASQHQRMPPPGNAHPPAASRYNNPSAAPPRSSPALYDPMQPTEEVSFPSPEVEKNRVTVELEQLRQAGKLRFSWLEIDQVFLIVRRDDKTRSEVFSRVSSYADLVQLKNDIRGAGGAS